jgi:hypothetical protein
MYKNITKGLSKEGKTIVNTPKPIEANDLKSYLRVIYIHILKMMVPIQDIQGLVFNEYINLDNALKI